MIRYVGFDKDGTLIDDFRGYTKEWGKIIQLDFCIDAKDAEEVFVRMAGEPTDSQLTEALRGSNNKFSKKEIFQKAEAIAEILGKRVQGNLFPDVLPALETLKEKGYFIFVSSGQKEDIVKNDLERTGLSRFVDFFAGIKPEDPTYKKGEPHFRATVEHFGVNFETFIKEAVFVGDTLVDIEIPNKLGMISVARSGTFSKEKLLGMGANFVIPDLSTLPEVLKTL